MRRFLNPHPDSDSLAAAQLEVEVSHPRADALVLSYTVTGDMAAIRFPPVTMSERRDELWQHTCFEAFVRGSPGAAYYEFNFTPSTQWAAYRFSDYRSGKRVADEIKPPIFKVRSGPDSYTLQVSLTLNRLSNLPRNGLWHLGLSALIEDANGRKSYWALAHPPGKPDFHHPVCFAHEFSPAVQS